MSLLVLHGSCFLILFVWLQNSLYVARYVGRVFVKSSGKPIEILGKINQMAGFSPDEEIELYEVCFISFFKVSAFS